MEQKEIDIYEILLGMPVGTELYSPMLGDVTLAALTDREAEDAIYVDCKTEDKISFYKDGRYFECGDMILFPSKEMRDWKKFFKKGDVIEFTENDNRAFAVFDCWSRNEVEDLYTGFYARYAFSDVDGWLDYEINGFTLSWHKADNLTTRNFLESIEKKYGGKLNLETMEIVKAEKVEKVEKAERVERKPVHHFKLFDKVLVRDAEDAEWTPAIYQHDTGDALFKHRVFCFKHDFTCNYQFCIPFEGHEHLAYTNDAADTLPF